MPEAAYSVAHPMKTPRTKHYRKCRHCAGRLKTTERLRCLACQRLADRMFSIGVVMGAAGASLAWWVI